MASKMVTDRQKSAEAVLAIGQAQQHTIAKLEAARSTPAWKNAAPRAAGAATDSAGLIDTLSTQLLSARDAMVAADEAHERELADDPAARDARDACAAALVARLTSLREILIGVYGPAAAQQVMPGRTPQDPVVIARFAGEVASQLAQVTLPAPRIQGAAVDPQALARELETGRADLERCLEGVARELREHDASLVKKNQAIADYDQTFQGVANVLTGLFLLAGEDELADRVRPSTRRPGRTAVEDGSSDGAHDPSPPAA